MTNPIKEALKRIEEETEEVTEELALDAIKF